MALNMTDSSASIFWQNTGLLHYVALSAVSMITVTCLCVTKFVLYFILERRCEEQNANCPEKADSVYRYKERDRLPWFLSDL